MENLEMFALIVGFLSPLVISLINQPTWTRAARTAVMVGFSVLAGAGTAYFAGQLNGQDIATSILLVLVATITAYQGVFKPSGVAPALEKATSPKAKEAGPVEIYNDTPVAG